MYQLVLLRHGQSQWNLENRFTGWVDVDLSEKGIEEARAAGKLLKEAGMMFDVTYTSVLKRAIRTLWLATEELDALWLPQHRAWELNERHYGALQGLDKKESVREFGEAQVHQWRRGYAIRPPAMNDDQAKTQELDPRYAEARKMLGAVPRCESLDDTLKRVLPFWKQTLAPQIQAGKRVLIAAHGNSLRALVKHLDGVSDEAISELNIPTAVPLVYHLDRSLNPIKSEYLGDPEAVAQAVAGVAAQTK